MESLKSTVTFDRSDVEAYVLPIWKALGINITVTSIFDVKDNKIP